jgi:hypothetical protein
MLRVTMSRFTIISDEVRVVDGATSGDGMLIGPALLPDALGWELKPQGLCQNEVCVPVKDAAALFGGDKLDLAAVAAALGRPAVVDAPAGIAAVGLAAERRQQALDGLQAPSFTLSDLEGVAHQLEEWRGNKKLLVAFASW